MWGAWTVGTSGAAHPYTHGWDLYTAFAVSLNLVQRRGLTLAAAATEAGRPGPRLKAMPRTTISIAGSICVGGVGEERRPRKAT